MPHTSQRKHGPDAGKLRGVQDLGLKALLVVALAGTDPTAASHGVPLYCACYDLTERVARASARGTCDNAAHERHFGQGLLRFAYPSDPAGVVHYAPPVGTPCADDGRRHHACPHTKASATSLEPYICVGMGQAEGTH